MVIGPARALAAAALALAAGGPALAQGEAPAAAAAVSEWRRPDPDNTLLIETTKGRIVLEMRPEIAPLAVARIKALTRRGYYDGALFYRVMKGYMAQTGDKGARTFKSDLPNLRAEFTFRRTAQTPFVSVGKIAGGEVGYIGSAPVQVSATGEGWALYCPGAAAMPHYDDPNSGNSQFFLMRARAPSLEKAFTVWGRVIEGQEVVDAIKDGEPPPNPDRMTRVRVLVDAPAAQRPRLQVLDAASPAFATLVQEKAKTYGTNFSLCEVKVPVRTEAQGEP